MASELIVFSAVEADAHEMPAGHPERHGRLAASLAGIEAAGLTDAVEWREPTQVPLDDLKRIHDSEYISLIERTCTAGGGRLDPDTRASSGSWATARRSAGAVLDAIAALRAGECDVAFAAGRPPGHHATRNKAMGFCLFNNAAVGAAAIAAAGERVAIVDWDVHHGNGTQDIFYDDPNVFYVSTHQSGLYPGTGFLDEVGTAAGIGSTMNLPFPVETTGDAYRAGLDEVVTPALEKFCPDWLIISAGFDAHRDDPLGGIGLAAGDYGDMAIRLQGLVPARRVVVVLEGGYDLAALTSCTGATLSALLGGSYRPEAATSGIQGMSQVAQAARIWSEGFA